MRLNKAKITNYKSIKNSGIIEMKKNISIFAGKNNTGKTAFIEALYKSVNSSLIDFISESATSMLTIELNIDEDELNLINRGMSYEYQLVGGTNRILIDISFHTELNCSCINRVHVIIDGNPHEKYLNLSANASDSVNYILTTPRGDNTTHVGRPAAINNIFELLKENIVFISGTRHVSTFETKKLHHSLAIEGNNLNAYLYSLHNNNELAFDRINKVFAYIFDDVISLNTPIFENGTTHVRLLFKGLDKPIPLYDCGSGYTHVLMLLCLLYTRESSIVLFDEPHVFLHPSAEKAIYDLISQNQNHHYILTTHSPILINYPFEKIIYHVQKEDGLSKFLGLENIQQLVKEIGLSNSDFALSDKVLFVEGETEEAVIPLILMHFGIQKLGYNYKILNMKGTGNAFIRKTAMSNYRDKLNMILNQISNSPIPYKILIDPDERNDEKINEILEKYEDSIIILERREYENYLLDCYSEISEVINECKKDSITTADEVMNKITEVLSCTDDQKLFKREKSNPINHVVGSKVLERVFNDYGLSYNKVFHGKKITIKVLRDSEEKLFFFKERLCDFINA